MKNAISFQKHMSVSLSQANSCTPLVLYDIGKGGLSYVHIPPYGCDMEFSCRLVMLDGLLGQQLLNFLDLEELQRRLDNTVEEEGEVDEQGEANHLQPLECLPAKTEGDNPDEEGAARVNG